MIPMRDGVHLQTVVSTKANQTEKPLPSCSHAPPTAFFTQQELRQNTPERRTAPTGYPTAGKTTSAADGYILSGKILAAADFKSEGAFSSLAVYGTLRTPPQPKTKNQRGLRGPPWTGAQKMSPKHNRQSGLYESPTNGLTAASTCCISPSGR